MGFTLFLIFNINTSFAELRVHILGNSEVSIECVSSSGNCNITGYGGSGQVTGEQKGWNYHFVQYRYNCNGVQKVTATLDNVNRVAYPEVQGQGKVTLQRYWNSRIGDHFYTTNWGELGAGGGGWQHEGVAGCVMPYNDGISLPLYRYWNSRIGDHFYTTSWNELGSGGNGWSYEGVAGWMPIQANSSTLTFHRYWNPRIGDHFYTTNWGELRGGGNGWSYEGGCCNIYIN